jgi:hypothetical protein
VQLFVEPISVSLFVGRRCFVPPILIDEMKILILPKYGQMAATTRYRFTQYLPFLTGEGITFTVSPLLSDAYLAGRFQSGRTPLVEVMLCYLVRMGLLLRILLGATAEACLKTLTPTLAKVRKKDSRKRLEKK